MSDRRKVAWAAAILFLLLVAALGIPTLMRVRPGTQELAPSSESRSASMNAMLYTGPENAGLARMNAPAADNASALPDRKVIRNAELGLTVTDVRKAAEQIRKITETDRGEVDNLDVNEAAGSVSATIVVRVPASGLVAALTEIKQLAVRTDHEQVSGRDVTREFYDNEAHMRDLQAEEQQYLTIMKQARSVTDILAVSEKLSEVRDRIERLQTQIQVMTHDIEMSAVAVTLTQESDTRVLGIQWRPLYKAKIATHELFIGLGEWTDWVIAVLIKLPLILLWVLTVGAMMWIVWKIGRRTWPRFAKSKNVSAAQ